MFSRVRTVLFVLLLTALMTGIGLSPAAAQLSCTNGKITTLDAEGVPNLYRLGLKYNVPWQSIQTASGITDVRRVGPNQLLCVPSFTPGTGTTSTPTPGSPASTPVPTAGPTSTPIVGGYCDAIQIHGIPVDKGSCTLELFSIQLGIQSILETGVKCVPRTTEVRNGIPAQCSVRGDIWISLPFGVSA